MTVEEDMQKELAALQLSLAPLEAELAARQTHEAAQLALLAEEQLELTQRLAAAERRSLAHQRAHEATQVQLARFQPGKPTARDKLVANLSAFGAVTMLALCALAWSPLIVDGALDTGVALQVACGLLGAGLVHGWQRLRAR